MKPAIDHGTLQGSIVLSMTDQHESTEAAPRHQAEAAVRDHLANERTLLAWQRTALALVGIGFVVDRFALGPEGVTPLGTLLGVLLIALGGAVSAVGAYRFVRTEREIDTQTYRPSILAHLVLTGAVVIGAVLLALFVLVAPS
jgi:putative membrane protein